eukprot:CAMPEP_0115013128 /NCGR_PEP_ID=MMETSP0216-20121206/25201_1 /TAXON_ID=223996 /ORGANISM="Protocruzia adherens, Strain Boccale" /LENGTH=1245 /DNA_ID=CAMNT_0002382423 /DNA_START=124 /DNA_END=3861 /DNA_ORIENTATION=+
MGSASDILHKPPELTQSHINSFRYRVMMGTHFKLRGNTAAGSRNTTAKIEDTGPGRFAPGGEDKLSLTYTTESPYDEPNQIMMHKELFQENSNAHREIRIREDYLDFSFCDRGRVSDVVELTVENSLNLKINAHWFLSGNLAADAQVDPNLSKLRVNFSDPDFRSNFSIVPESAEIKPKSTFTFKVTFRPHERHLYFFQYLTCFFKVNFKGRTLEKEREGLEKSMNETRSSRGKLSKSYSMIGSRGFKTNKSNLDPDLIPPLAMKVPAVGHSFPPSEQSYVPFLKFSPPGKIKFPPCAVGESVYQTLQLTNDSDTPVYYRLVEDPGKNFRYFPYIGLIAPKSFALVAVEFAPKTAREFRYNVQVVLNHSHSNTRTVQLMGHCNDPSLYVANGSKMYFAPSSTNVIAKQSLMIQNTSKIPIDYVWEIPDKYKEDIFVEQPYGQLLSNEDLLTNWSFVPHKKKDYRFSVGIKIKQIQDPRQEMVGYSIPGSGAPERLQTREITAKDHAGKSKLYEVFIYGTGGDGAIKIEPSQIDFKTLTVGFSSIHVIEVFNHSPCALLIELKLLPQDISRTEDRARWNETIKIIKEAFKLDFTEGTIPANSKRKVKISFTPKSRFDFKLFLQCVAKESQAVHIREEGEAITEPREKSSIQVFAKGDYPLLQFIDLRNNHMSLADCWAKFNLNRVNEELLKPLTPTEYSYNNSQSMDKTKVARTQLSKFDWDFGKLHTKFSREPRKLTVTMKNVGGVDCGWHYKLPSDSEVDVEPWADPGDPTPEYAFEKHVLNRHIFEIQPREGWLKAGENCNVEVYYNPIEVAKHNLNVIFELTNGKPVVFNLVGETLPNKHGHIEIRDHIFTFNSLPIGQSVAVTQPLELRNVGGSKVTYEIDTDVIDEFNGKSSEMAVFSIQNPTGVLLSGDVQYLYCLFKPIETKAYCLDIPMKVIDSDGVRQNLLLTLMGEGYHPLTDKPKDVKADIYKQLPSARADATDGSQVSLSLEEVDFAEVDETRPSRRIVVLSNMSKVDTFRFEFKKTGLICGDELNMDPIVGEVAPSSHLNINLTLKAARIPTSFQGEIECQIAWLANREANTQSSLSTASKPKEVQIRSMESVFLRISKRCSLKKYENALDVKPKVPLFEGIFTEALQNILVDPFVEELFGKLEKQPSRLYAMMDDGKAPNPEHLTNDIFEEIMTDQPRVTEEDDLFLTEEFRQVAEEVVENTARNIIYEATYGEVDLLHLPRTYFKQGQEP